MDEVLKCVTSDGVLKKRNSILRPFSVKFWFERPVLSSAQLAQNKHKKNWRARGNYQMVFLMILCVNPRKEVKIF